MQRGAACAPVRGPNRSAEAASRRQARWVALSGRRGRLEAGLAFALCITLRGSVRIRQRYRREKRATARKMQLNGSARPRRAEQQQSRSAKARVQRTRSSFVEPVGAFTKVRFLSNGP